ASAEGADLAGGELPPRAGTKPTELERPQTHAAEAQDAESDGRAHAPHLALPSGGEDHAQGRSASSPRDRHPSRSGDAFLERDPATQRRERRSRDRAGDADLV